MRSKKGGLGVPPPPGPTAGGSFGGVGGVAFPQPPHPPRHEAPWGLPRGGGGGRDLRQDPPGGQIQLLHGRWGRERWAPPLPPPTSPPRRGLRSRGGQQGGVYVLPPPKAEVRGQGLAPKGMGGGGQPLPTPSIAPPTLEVLCLRGVGGVGGVLTIVSPRACSGGCTGWLRGREPTPFPAASPPPRQGGRTRVGVALPPAGSPPWRSGGLSGVCPPPVT